MNAQQTEVQVFPIRDATGRVRAMIELDPAAPDAVRVLLADSQGRVRASACVPLVEEPWACLHDSASRQRVMIAMTTNGNPGVTLIGQGDG